MAEPSEIYSAEFTEQAEIGSTKKQRMDLCSMFKRQAEAQDVCLYKGSTPFKHTFLFPSEPQVSFTFFICLHRISLLRASMFINVEFV